MTKNDLYVSIRDIIEIKRMNCKDTEFLLTNHFNYIANKLGIWAKEIKEIFDKYESELKKLFRSYTWDNKDRMINNIYKDIKLI